MKTSPLVPLLPSPPLASSLLPVLPPVETGKHHACPCCGGKTQRVPRRLFDHLRSLITPVFRYCCRNARCQWEGTLPGEGDVSRRHYYLSSARAKLTPARKDG